MRSIEGVGGLPAITALGGGQEAWTTVASIHAVVMVLTMIIVVLGTKERVVQQGDRSSTAQPARVLCRSIVRNRSFVVVAGLFVCFSVFNGVTAAAGVYSASDVLRDEAAFGLLSVASLVPVLVGIPFMSRAFQRFGTRPLFLIGAAVMLGSLIPVLAPESLPVVLAGQLVRGAGAVPDAVGPFAIVADVIGYGEYRFGVRADGLAFSAVTIGIKAGSGIGAGLPRRSRQPRAGEARAPAAPSCGAVRCRCLPQARARRASLRRRRAPGAPSEPG